MFKRGISIILATCVCLGTFLNSPNVYAASSESIFEISEEIIDEDQIVDIECSSDAAASESICDEADASEESSSCENLESSEYASEEIELEVIQETTDESIVETIETLEEQGNTLQATQYCGKNVTWKLTGGNRKTLRISGSGPMYDYDISSEAPWRSDRFYITSIIVDEGVTSIGNYAFDGLVEASYVSLPSTLVTIGEYSFGNCKDLRRVNLPNGLLSIGDGAFFWCIELEEVNIPEELTYLGAEVFCKTKIQSADIPCGVTKLYVRTFSECKELTKVTLPDGLTDLMAGNFGSCEKLESINLPETLENIGPTSFSGCHNLKEIRIPDKVEKIGELAFADSGITSLTLGKKVKKIGDTAFAYCDDLENVYMFPGEYELGWGIFLDDSKLSSIELPSGLAEVSKSMFGGCSGLTEVFMPKSVKKIEWAGFGGCSQLKDVYYEGNQQDFSRIEIGDNNDGLDNVTFHYNWRPASKTGNYWGEDTKTGYPVSYYENGAKLKDTTRKLKYIYDDIIFEGNWCFDSDGKVRTGVIDDCYYNENPSNGYPYGIQLEQGRMLSILNQEKASAVIGDYSYVVSFTDDLNDFTGFADMITNFSDEVKALWVSTAKWIGGDVEINSFSDWCSTVTYYYMNDEKACAGIISNILEEKYATKTVWPEDEYNLVKASGRQLSKQLKEDIKQQLKEEKEKKTDKRTKEYKEFLARLDDKKSEYISAEIANSFISAISLVPDYMEWFTDYSQNIEYLESIEAYVGKDTALGSTIKRVRIDYETKACKAIANTFITAIKQADGWSNILLQAESNFESKGVSADIIPSYSNNGDELIVGTLLKCLDAVGFSFGRIQGILDYVNEISPNLHTTDKVVHSTYLRTQALNALKRAENDLQTGDVTREKITAYTNLFYLAKELTKVQYKNMCTFYSEDGPIVLSVASNIKADFLSDEIEKLDKMGPFSYQAYKAAVIKGWDWTPKGKTYSYIPHADNSCLNDLWKKVDGEWYYFRDGYVLTGWQVIDGKTHYFKVTEGVCDPTEGAAITGEKIIDGSEYYFDKRVDHGAMVKNQYVNTKYYGADGKRDKSKEYHKDINDKVYAANIDGTIYTHNCPVDIFVLDSASRCVASIVSNAEHDNDMNDHVYVWLDENLQKRVFTPKDEGYKIRIVATDKGEFNYTVSDYYAQTKECGETAYFQNLTISSMDELYSMDIKQESSSGDVYYEHRLYVNGQSEPVTMRTDAVLYYNVEVIAEDESKGEVSGGGLVEDGSFVLMKATPNDGYRFCYWTDEDGCVVSREQEIRVPVNDNVRYTAIFDIYDEQRGIWGEILNNPDSSDGQYYYCGKAIKPQIRVYDGDSLLSEKTDYSIKYANNVKPFVLAEGDEGFYNSKGNTAAPSVTIIGKGNYSGKEIIYFKIKPIDISETNPESFCDPIAVVYTGKEIKPVPTISVSGKVLKANIDFGLTYYKNDGYDSKESPGEAYASVREAGKYVVRITGKGNYTGVRDIELNIVKKSDSRLITGLTFSKISDQTYDGGAEIRPSITVKDGKVRLVPKSDDVAGEYDYSVLYENNTEPGTGYVVITGNQARGYCGTKRIPFKIVGRPMQNVQITGIPASVKFNGNENSFDEEIKAGLVTLKDKRTGSLLTIYDAETGIGDFKVSYSNNLHVGKATITFVGINGYVGSISKTFKITPYSMNGDLIEIVVEDSAVYSKNGAKASVDVVFTATGMHLEQGKDYTVSYKKNVKVGNAASVVVKGKGDFKDIFTTRPLSFTVKKQDIRRLKINASDVVFQNKAGSFATKVTVTDLDGKVLIAGKDYEKAVEYRYYDSGELVGKNDIVPAGTVLIATIIGKGNYANKANASFRVSSKSIAGAKVNIPTQKYLGKQIIINEKDITVKIGGVEIPYTDSETGQINWKIVDSSYKNNINRGKASVTIVGQGNYGGTKTCTFNIGTKSFLWWWR